MIRVRRALLSASDKSGLVEFAQGLARLGVELLSTGGTAHALRAAGLPVTDVADVTGFPEMLDGRVKTLHPGIHGGLLAVRGNADHERQLAAQGIAPIDLVAITLYPFEETLANPDRTVADVIEQIDIGGPAMLRSAAKNFAGVAVLADPGDYPAVLAELRDTGGSLSPATRVRLARKAFAHTARYDAAIAGFFERLAGDEPPTQSPRSPPSSRLSALGSRLSALLSLPPPHPPGEDPGAALRRESPSTRGVLSGSGPAGWSGRGPAAPGKRALVQQPARSARRLGAGGRIPGPGGGHRQAQQSLRRGHRGHALRRLLPRPRGGPGLGLRRDHRPESAAGRRHGPGHRRHLRGGGDRPRLHRRGAPGAGGQEESPRCSTCRRRAAGRRPRTGASRCAG